MERMDDGTVGGMIVYLDDLIVKNRAEVSKIMPLKSAVRRVFSEMIEYPFPLSDGSLTTLRLPKQLSQADAERLHMFIGSLAVDGYGSGVALAKSKIGKTSGVNRRFWISLNY